ncbi:hypothetical protein CsatA_006567 [Cannabis sativa]
MRTTLKNKMEIEKHKLLYISLTVYYFLYMVINASRSINHFLWIHSIGKDLLFKVVHRFIFYFCFLLKKNFFFL